MSEPTIESTLLTHIDTTLKELSDGLHDAKTLDDLNEWMSAAELDVKDLLAEFKTLRRLIK